MAGQYPLAPEDSHLANSSSAARSFANRIQSALAWHREGQIARAEAEYSEILSLAPGHAEALRFLGICKLQQNEVDLAIDLLRAAAKAAPQDAPTFANLGSALASSGNLQEALASFERAVALQPDESGFHSLHADTLLALGRAAEALEAYDRAIALSPNSFEAHNNRGNALRVLSDAQAALRSFDRARRLAPNHPAPHNNTASALLELRRPSDALASCRVALAFQPDYADAWYNSGSALMDLGQLDEAAEHFSKVIEIDPHFLKARFNQGLTFELLSRYSEAEAQFGRLLEQRADYPQALGHLIAARMHCCSWRGLDDLQTALAQGVEAGRPVCDPFTLLTVFDDPLLQLRCARQFVADEVTTSVVNPSPPAPRTGHTGERIRIAYVSADFHDHATVRLLAEVLERHDRSQFELTGVSFGPDDGSAMRARVAKAFDRFIDVRETSDSEVAAMLRSAQIDIAVDLKGYTANSRTGIFARRPAPVQASFLGYPGTLGAPFMDYLIADPIVVPDAHRAAYSESIVYLPHCYQPNDSTRPLAATPMTRAEAGLPADAFVFCCFNNSYKLTATIFDVWMRMLRSVSGSVLWLLHDNDTAVHNLRAEAQGRGVEAERLIFAPRVAPAEHLARHRLADLFLDTVPVNAHTTASDALWAGLPLLTCAGAGFAARVAASALHAIGLPELVTTNLSEYELLGVKLATDSTLLGELSARLAHNRSTHPLFDANLFREHLESAYRAMWSRYSAGGAPRDIRVEA